MEAGKASMDAAGNHKEWIERLSPNLYIRFSCGPNHEDAYLCVEDGEPDMNDIAKMSFGQARALKAAFPDPAAAMREVREFAAKLAAALVLGIAGFLAILAIVTLYRRW